MVIKIAKGIYHGRTLLGPKSKDIRPASVRVRDSLFNILGDLSGYDVLDLFSGIGAIGIECLSNGASSVTFVDQYREAVNITKKNLRNLKLQGQAKIMETSVFDAIRRLHQKNNCFDLIFVDPPYEKDLLNPTLKLLKHCPIYGKNSRVICEHSPREELDTSLGFALVREKKYGQTQISILNLELEKF